MAPHTGADGGTTRRRGWWPHTPERMVTQHIFEPSALGRRLRSQLDPTEGIPTPLLHADLPFDQLGRVSRKVLDERPDRLLIASVWPRSW